MVGLNTGQPEQAQTLYRLDRLGGITYFRYLVY